MVRKLGHFLLGIIIVAIPSHAIETRNILLEGEGKGPVQVQILERSEEGLRIEFVLPSLQEEVLEIQGEEYRHYSFDGANVDGIPGQAALPIMTQLVAVPEGRGLRLRSISESVELVGQGRLLPLQAEGAENFEVDGDYYGSRSSGTQAGLELGEPAVLRDLRVVPLSFQPLSYDPSSGEIRVTSRIEVELEFQGLDSRAEVPVHRNFIPESFANLYRTTVLNSDRLLDGVEEGPGTYLMVHANSSAVLTRIQPLIEWRQKQGYNVEVVSTAQTGSSASSIKNYIQDVYDNNAVPLEFVVLIGDANGSFPVATWFEGLSGYGGEGDHYYCNLAGNDVLADIHIGRLSFTSTGSLEDIIDKIMSYETDPYMASTTWFDRAVLCGDPGSSGITCIYVHQWARDELLEEGYSDIDSIWGGNFPSQLTSNLNQGESFFSYRGYWNMSGFSTGHISALSNGTKLPFAVVITCDTGSFSSGTSRSEAFLRAPNGGAIGCIGTATIGTHTRFNNCMFNGIAHGFLNSGDYRMGPALTRGKLEMYNNYQLSQPSKVEIWSVWNNLMGDPAVEIFTAEPQVLSVNHPGSLPTGANSVPVTVFDSGMPVKNARVALFKNGEVRSTGWTNSSGQVLLGFEGASAGEMFVTVTGHNLYPYQGSLSLESQSIFVGLESTDIDDDNSGQSQGNNDGQVNPGETLELSLTLKNMGSSTASNVSATLSSSDSFASILSGSANCGDIPAGASVQADFLVEVGSYAPDAHDIGLSLLVQSGFQTWTSLVALPVMSAEFEVIASGFTGPGEDLDPGESGDFFVELYNSGSVPSGTITATLSTESPWVGISDSQAVIPSVNPGESESNSGDGFTISIADECFGGHLAAFALTLQYSNGATEVVEHVEQVGSASSNEPTGPDSYGYYAFDNSDTNYLYAPTYGWVELSPGAGGPGTDLNLSDNGWEQDDTKVVNLPFGFQYYGETFNQISVCSNGWMTMGTTSLVHYRNWNIPSAGSPENLIAPFWDNLYQSGTYSDVYTWYDTDNHRFVIEWNSLRNDWNNSYETFEVFLYDPANYETATGDGRIVFQYATVSNVDSENGYATVGIQNGDNTDGVLYTYWNQYAPGASTIASGRAIAFEPISSMELGYLGGVVTNATADTPLPGCEIYLPETGRTLYSGDDGAYWGSVEAGTYTVVARHYSFEPDTTYGVDVSIGETVNRNFSLNDILGPRIENTTVYPYTPDTAGPYVIQSNVTDYSDVASANLTYTVLGQGVPVTLPMTSAGGGGLVEASIPGQSEGSRISYWINAWDEAGNESADPAGAPGDAYVFWVTTQVDVFADDMESDQGWSVGDAGDDAETGIWTRVDPNATWYGSEQVNPEDDATDAPGVLCWITGDDAAGANQGAADVDGGKTTLFSPVLDLTDLSNVALSYRRWYTNDTGNAPGEDYWVVQVTDDGSNWVTLEDTNASDRSWAYKSFTLEDYIDMTANVRLRFIASDEGSGSVVEAGVDEFYLVGFEVPDVTDGADSSVPLRTVLLPNTPNPFNPKTEIRFGLESEGPVELDIFDASGRRITRLVDHRMDAGFHSVQWDGRNSEGRSVSSGLYFYSLKTQTERLQGKMTLLK
ncbi:MAG: C25 family cysteine peptidase [Candidatus Krumholzibacteria bacterium]|jgi:hypothetical protein|nr:C25 family cysteine peptidase [Candidatus Krumholzibacteria bacterium]MDP6668611.1 C25 family cysteine peptidase [Candidatus Krumholzibacteria bacterium]MDP7022301.1 C25 family cysteine peptidase [Candidatus Krumholzibacteria bacterium]